MLRTIYVLLVELLTVPLTKFALMQLHQHVELFVLHRTVFFHINVMAIHVSKPVEHLHVFILSSALMDSAKGLAVINFALQPKNVSMEIVLQLVLIISIAHLVKLAQSQEFVFLQVVPLF
jgi:hypothetical protein